ncbi:branched-subunit amino acid transport protein AzlD [Haloactinopolyspora alba]|uniref:Branched-subunit amino acid transport protein AzlD n=1 Tax=Haloactinopolyspora alba TaxID=648780 RepID=A0A2P8E5N3_9ACTN|nr:AzlD domain-containing protein [Haloactinopolyspora alba]PSL04778.1 branched-subunit amino acid transport protein AzlD [Haloactinopolyspora alba]
MIDTAHLVPAIIAFAAGTYALRAGGVFLRHRVSVTDEAEQVLDRAVVTLLTAVLLTAALFTTTELAGAARPTGVVAGGLAALARAPLVVVVVVAATTTGVLRLMGID